MNFLRYCILCLGLLLTGCFPIAVAPDLTQGKHLKAKKFHKQLPDRHAYAFTDPKEADAFYYYLYTKFQQHPDADTYNLPVTIANTPFYVTFYEMGKATKTLQLLNPLVNEVLARNNLPEVLDDEETIRYGDDVYYIILMVNDASFQDALHPQHRYFDRVQLFCEDLHQEYLATRNANQLLLAKKQQ